MGGAPLHKGHPGPRPPGTDMQLTDVPGIGPAYAERLEAAGVHDAESLANATDVAALADAAGIPRTRLEASAIQARLLLDARPEESGVAMELPESGLQRWMAEAAGTAMTIKEWATEKARHLSFPSFRRGRAA